jgi:hypothetical protein
VDGVEAASLDKLAAGEDIAVTVDEDNSRLRMVSAIRATETCMSCHDVQRGTLLGAFTFQMERLPNRVGFTRQIGRLETEIEYELRKTLQQKITLKLKNVAVVDAISQILADTGITISIDAQALEELGVSAKSTVSAEFDDVGVSSALTVVLRELDLVRSVDGNVLLVTRDTTPTF